MVFKKNKNEKKINETLERLIKNNKIKTQVVKYPKW